MDWAEPQDRKKIAIPNRRIACFFFCNRFHLCLDFFYVVQRIAKPLSIELFSANMLGWFLTLRLVTLVLLIWTCYFFPYPFLVNFFGFWASLWEIKLASHLLAALLTRFTSIFVFNVLSPHQLLSEKKSTCLSNLPLYASFLFFNTLFFCWWKSNS